jgi:uncharacterized protein
MVSLKEYIIAYKGLKNGQHFIDFDIPSSFFLHFETSRIKEGQFTVQLLLDKRDTIMVLDFTIEGQVSALCDRCTAPIQIDINGEDQLIIKLTEEKLESTEEVIYLDPKESLIDLTEVLYEMIHVQVPILAIRDCESEDYKYCDHDALDILENLAIDEDENQDDKNPLWKGLEDIEL